MAARKDRPQHGTPRRPEVVRDDRDAEVADGGVSPQTGAETEPEARAAAHALAVAAWRQISERLRREYGDSLYRSWLARIAVVGFADGVAELAVATPFEKDWVERHYGDRIRSLWAADGRFSASPVFVVAPPQPPESAARPARGAPPLQGRPSPRPSLAAMQGNAAAGQASPAGAGQTPRIAALKADPAFSIAAPLQDTEADDEVGAPLDPRLTFENFVVGKPNELAHAAAFRVADTDGVELNPLYLYGGVGLGKTHLMHAIAWHIRRTRPHRKVMYLSAEKFMYRFIRSMKDKDTLSFKELFRSADVLMVDDMQFLGGKDSTQEEFFHTFNALIDQNRQIVLSADKSPSDLERIDERLRSRLGWGLVADIHPTTYELRRGILMSKVERLQIEIPEKVLEFLAHRISANVRELEGALNRLAAQQRLVGRPITLETAQEVLHDLLRSNDRRLTIEDIKKKVAEYFKVKLSDMSSDRRARDVARPRQVAMYLAKQLTQRSLPEIGRQFGGRDHTTVMHAVKRVEELVGTDAAFAEDVDLLRRMLEG